MALCALSFPDSCMPGAEHPPRDTNIDQIDGFKLSHPNTADAILDTKAITRRSLGDRCNNAFIATLNAHGDGDAHMYHDPFQDDDNDDGSVASRLIRSIGKSMLGTSLFNSAFASCEEVVRETPFQRSLRLRNMNLQQCTEELGSESYSSPDASAEDNRTSNTAVDQQCSLCGFTHLLEEYCLIREREANISVPTLFCRWPGVSFSTDPPLLKTQSLKSNKFMSAFPPPLSSTYCATTNSGRAGGDRGSLLQRLRQDGRLLLTEVKFQRPPSPRLQAARGGGRLTLFLPHHHPDSTCHDDDADLSNYSIPYADEASHQHECCADYNSSNTCPAISSAFCPAIFKEGDKRTSIGQTPLPPEETCDILGDKYYGVADEPVLVHSAIGTSKLSSTPPIFLKLSSTPPIFLASFSYSPCKDNRQLQTQSVAQLAVNTDVVLPGSTAIDHLSKCRAIPEFLNDDGTHFSGHHLTDMSTGPYNLDTSSMMNGMRSEWLHCKEHVHFYSNELDKIKVHCVATQ